MTRSRPAVGLAIVAALTLTLAGCGRPSSAPGNEGNAASAEASNAAAAAADLAALIDLAVVATRRRLPWKIDDITTMTSIRSQGTEIVYEMTIDADIPAGQIERAPASCSKRKVRRLYAARGVTEC